MRQRLEDVVNRFEYVHPNMDCSEVAEYLQSLVGGELITFRNIASEDLVMTPYLIKVPAVDGDCYLEFVYHTVLMQDDYMCEPLMVRGLRVINLRDYLLKLYRLNGSAVISDNFQINNLLKEIAYNGG